MQFEFQLDEDGLDAPASAHIDVFDHGEVGSGIHGGMNTVWYWTIK